MAKNDVILIDGIIDDRIINKHPSDLRGEVFEYFAVEQILKDNDLSSDEIQNGIIDGRDDGGIDGFFIFVNGHYFSDIDTFSWPKSGITLEMSLITCKHHDTFQQATLDALIASISELFDFSISDHELRGQYSKLVLKHRNLLKYAYKKASPKLSHFAINFYYISRGDTNQVGDSVYSRSSQITGLLKSLFGNCISNFSFIGSAELIEKYRKIKNFSLDVSFSDILSSGETYILLVQLAEYFRFISNDGKLRRYLFDSNVRDYMGLNRVNQDIGETLANNQSPDFWWLNNGVTILATGAHVVGKSIQIEDIQIVNGLQTSESIYRYFSSGAEDVNSRSVLVKVIVSNNNEHRDEIIRATNNQTNVEISALHATDKIQRDIEELLKRYDYYYERRTNYYSNQEIPAQKIVTPMYLTAGYVTLLLKSPRQGSMFTSRFLNNDVAYERVFYKSNIKIWPKICYILKKTDAFLDKKRPNLNSTSEKFLKNFRQYVSFFSVARIFKNYNFTENDLIDLEDARYDEHAMESTWEIVTRHIPVNLGRLKIKYAIFISVCEDINAHEDMLGYDRILNNGNSNLFGYERVSKPLDDDFLEKVDMELPDQPWKRRVHIDIAIKLNCTPDLVSRAINQLVATGRRLKQIDGVTFDINNEVVSYDPDRVDPSTMKLFQP